MGQRLIEMVFVGLMLSGSAVAQEPDLSEAKEFWDRQKALAEAFDPRFAEAYAADAEIINRRMYPAPSPPREMRMTGAVWSTFVRQAMPFAKARGDVSFFRDEAFEAVEGNCAKLTATRYSELEKYDSPHEVVMCLRSGSWVITREVTASRP